MCVFVSVYLYISTSLFLSPFFFLSFYGMYVCFWGIKLGALHMVFYHYVYILSPYQY